MKNVKETPEERLPDAPVAPDAPEPEGRREFLAKAASAVFAGLVLGAVGVSAEAKAEGATGVMSPPAPFAVAADPDEDVLIRMQRELQRALEKPLDQRRWGMVIDTRKCVGCHACTVGCVMENKLSPGVVYRPVIDQEVGEYPNVARKFLPRPCMQCENPPCTEACPVGATYKRGDGVVVIDYDACIGCRYCISACPYQARTFDFGEYWTETAPSQSPVDHLASFEYGRQWAREGEKSPIGNARKCTFCIHRVDQGMLPACVTTCIGRATYFGDLNDPKSLVSETLAAGNVVRLKEELGTEPKVYYLV